MKVLLFAAAAVLVVSVLASAVLGAKFRISLRREAPHLHEAYWGAAESRSLRVSMVLPFMMLLYFRKYRRELEPYPVSRAWASWIFANNWIYTIAMLVIVAVTIGGPSR